MSWDIFVADYPKHASTVEDIPDDYRPPAIGTRTDIIARIKDVVPSADFSDPSWGRIRGDTFSIEVNLGDDEELMGFAFHVRGGEDAVDVIAGILDHLNLRAVESGSGGFFERHAAIAGFRQWRSYRDRVIG